MSDLYIKKEEGIECRCDGCRRKIRAKDHRETMSGMNSEGQPFIKTLCQICIDDIVKQFREHLKEKEKEKDGEDGCANTTENRGTN